MIKYLRSSIYIITFDSTTITPVCETLSSSILFMPYGEKIPSLCIVALIVPQITDKTS